jgi:hypothetical protein
MGSLHEMDEYSKGYVAPVTTNKILSVRYIALLLYGTS